ncbi:hypothetical protein D3C86_1204300 [compost metagenome]
MIKTITYSVSYFLEGGLFGNRMKSKEEVTNTPAAIITESNNLAMFHFEVVKLLF